MLLFNIYAMPRRGASLQMRLAFFLDYLAVQRVTCHCARTSTRALLYGLAQEGASHTTKIGNGILRKVIYDFFNPPTATIASSHHHLPTSPCSSLHPALTGAAVNVRQVQPRASSSAFSACVSTYLADPKPLLWCTLVMECLLWSRAYE